MPLIAGTVLLVFLAAIAALGYGSAVSDLLRIEPNLGDRGIMGLLSFGVLGSLIHFVVPLTLAVHFAVLAGGIIAAVIFRTVITKPRIALAAGAIIFLYALSHLQSSITYDTGLYHLQAMRWIREQHIVPGLGNLHGRLAFNSMLFLVAGVVDQSKIGWISNLFVILFVLLSLLIRLRNVTADGRSALEFWFLVLSIFIFSENHYISGWYGVLNADLFTAILIIYWTAVALGLSASPRPVTEIGIAVLSAVLAIAVKLSAAPLLLPAVALVWIHRKRLPAASTWRIASTASLVLLIWMLRGITLSGCAIYPIPQTCISSLPWAESDHQVRIESLSIKSWARRPGDTNFVRVLKDRAWLPPWFNSVQHDRSIRLVVIFAPLGLIAALLRRRFHGELARCLLVISGGLIGCLIFWFVTAPDPRFGEGFLLATALLGGSVTLAASFDKPRFAVYVPGLVVACMALVSIHAMWSGRVRSNYFYAAQEVATYQLKGPNGNSIFVPKVGDQCWDHPLPCTPYFDPEALARMEWPWNWPMPPAEWTPDDVHGTVMKDGEGK